MLIIQVYREVSLYICLIKYLKAGSNKSNGKDKSNLKENYDKTNRVEIIIY